LFRRASMPPPLFSGVSSSEKTAKAARVRSGMCKNTYFVGLCKTLEEPPAQQARTHKHAPTAGRGDPHGRAVPRQGERLPVPRARSRCVGAAGREGKPHTWPQPSVGPAGIWRAQSLPQEPPVELSCSRGQQPAHICAD